MVGIFENVEAVAFYGGFFFGVGYVIWKGIKKESTSATFAPVTPTSRTTDLTLEIDERKEEISPRIEENAEAVKEEESGDLDLDIE